MVQKLLLKIAKSVLAQVIQQLQNQVIRVLGEQIRNPIQGMIQEVVGGVWIGEGADAFVNELTSLFIPETEKLSASCGVIQANIINSQTIIEQADVQARSLVDSMVNTFAAIY